MTCLTLSYTNAKNGWHARSLDARSSVEKVLQPLWAYREGLPSGNGQMIILAIGGRQNQAAIQGKFTRLKRWQ